jgi:hypothetical protein
MKTLFILIFSLALALPCQSQSGWFPPGAKWYYQYGSMAGSGMTFLEVLNEDTLIGMQSYQKIMSTTIGEFFGSQDTLTETLYVQEENQLVAGYDRYFGSTFLYDFNADPGDTLPMSFGGLSPAPFVVDSSGTIDFNGHMLTFQDIRFPNLFEPGEHFEMRVIERIGSSNSHLFHVRTVIQPFDAPSYYLRCYEDDDLGLIRLTDDSGPCNLLEGPTSTMESTESSIVIFPNPASDVVHVQHPYQGLVDFTVTDMLGAVRIKSNSVNSITFQIDISELENGLYYILATDPAGGILFTTKVTKHGR